jgi:hypothetical protein
VQIRERGKNKPTKNDNMKKPIKKTKDGKVVLGLQFIPQAGVYIGLIKGEKSNKSAMWSKDGVHIVRSTPGLNISL